MPRWRTHERFLKSIMPDINPQVSRKVNRALDSPSIGQKQISKSLGLDKYVMPGLTMYPHRRATHSLADSMMIGYMNGGVDGIKAAFAHDMLDAMRDQVVSRMGGYQADMWEAGFNMFMSKNKQSKRH